MGCFSWIYADSETDENMVGGKRADSYLLVPPKFQNTYGKYIKETHYDGYGRMGGYDVYDLVADWNKESATIENLIKPERDKWGNDAWSEEFYQNAVERYNISCKRLLDFKVKSDEEMEEIYGEDFKREIGIDIACYDEQNEVIEFPIKITSKPMEYEEVEPSKGDPHQGCEVFYEDDEYYWEWDDEDYEDD